MDIHSERGLLLRQLKNYLIFLRETGATRVPLQSELHRFPIMKPPITEAHEHMVVSNQRSSKKDASDSTLKKPELLKAVQDELGECTRCKLCEGRQNIVFGSGNPNADIVFVGEGPGADEDAQGLPFVGRAGKKLTEIIEKGMKLDREKDTYICNIVKCRPPGNRDPEKDEIEACKPFLIEQLRAIRPKVIVALGKPAASTLLGRNVPIT